MNILHMNSYYYAGKFYKNLYDIQNQSNSLVSVYVPISYQTPDSTFDYGKYTVIDKNHSKIDRCFFGKKHKKILSAVKEKFNLSDYQITHAHSLFSNGYISMKIKEQYSVPYVVTVRNTDVNVFFKKMVHMRSLGFDIMRNASKIIFLSQVYLEYVIEKYVPNEWKQEILDKSEVIPNGVDPFWLKNKANAKSFIGDKVVITQVGDINKNKNVITTVKAMEGLIRQGRKVELQLVGTVKDQKIFNTIKDLEFVNYLGYKSKEELLDIYRQTNVFVMPSITETFGLVYAEAMSQGLPVIYSKKQGFDGQFEDGFVGYSVTSMNDDEIAQAIIRIIEQYNTFSQNCIKACDKFEWNAIAAKYQEMYQEITSSQAE